ncbi:RNA polymerase sigma factor [Actinacidiphila oryziradicis]|uniref:RNA polymerase sigma factor 70 region 4 type 2 domain-containing protein n=1 Tax=Actinacidiphila oryziradicis TaxID=2571141 RepID=A0A4U0RGP6_9ACTN|nr:sigma-70 family RNA polymerase sigma factor [Actinacidiphila oryziradicis]TJZ94387.1 hypothetical protein FCI23_53830 [Actinacidiphila oryziradicis]
MIEAGDRFDQVDESLALFDAIGRLPHNQLDVTVLGYLCGMDKATIAHVLGVSPAIARAFDHHARGTLDGTRDPHDDYPGAIAP